MCLAVPMKVLKLEGDKARVSLSGLEQEVDVRFLDGLKPGEYVIVHAGFAIEKLDAAEAEETLALFQEIDEAADQPAD